MKETDIMRAIQLEATKLGGRLFRNNVGVALIRGMRVAFGIPGKGGSDLIGWLLIDGRAVFASIEVKTPVGRASKEQLQWIKTVNDAGGVAGICRSPEDLRRLYEDSI